MQLEPQTWVNPSVSRVSTRLSVPLSGLWTLTASSFLARISTEETQVGLRQFTNDRTPRIWWPLVASTRMG